MNGRFPDSRVERWFERRTYKFSALDPAILAESKRSVGLTIGVALPALDEEATIGRICRVIRDGLMQDTGLIDRLVVVDSGSSDRTVEVARSEGATVSAAADVFPDRARAGRGGKGEALWASLSLVDTDLVVWIDSDTRNFTADFVTSLVAPLLADPKIVMTKAFYHRPLVESGEVLRTGGARVTELAVRPLLHFFYPELTGVVQPLSGEQAIRRTAALELPLFTGYGVDIGILLDVVARHGLDAIAQTDLGTRVHRNRDIDALGRMAFQVMTALLSRCDDAGRVKLTAELTDALTQFLPGMDEPAPMRTDLAIEELPPVATLTSQHGQ